MLEARRGFYFQNELDMGEIPDVQRATHGFHPGRKGYQTVFMAVGPDIMPGVEIEEMSLMDEGPTMARSWDWSYRGQRESSAGDFPVV